MSRYTEKNFGKIFQLRIGSGEDLLLSVNRLLTKENIEDAVFLAGFGNLINCHTHYADVELKREVPVVIENTPMELCGLSGFIEDKGEKSVTHLHGVIFDGATARTVHIHEGCTVLDEVILVAAEWVDRDKEETHG